MPSPVGPCPFCRCGAIELIGWSPAYLHYRCDECAEVWTVTDAPPPQRPEPERRPRQLIH